MCKKCDALFAPFHAALGELTHHEKIVIGIGKKRGVDNKELIDGIKEARAEGIGGTLGNPSGKTNPARVEQAIANMPEELKGALESLKKLGTIVSILQDENLSGDDVSKAVGKALGWGFMPADLEKLLGRAMTEDEQQKAYDLMTQGVDVNAVAAILKGQAEDPSDEANEGKLRVHVIKTSPTAEPVEFVTLADYEEMVADAEEAMGEATEAFQRAKQFQAAVGKLFNDEHDKASSDVVSAEIVKRLGAVLHQFPDMYKVS